MTEPTAIDCVELSVTVPAAVLAVLEPALWRLSPNGILVEDADTLGASDLAPEQCRVALYVPVAGATTAADLLGHACRDVGVAVEVAAREVVREDWNCVWKQHYAPVLVGRRIRVEPSWLQSAEQPEVVRVAIDPGLAFGTGTHETTRLAMRAVEAWADGHGPAGHIATCDVLDVGTGSAILAILAVKLGARRAIGTDNDPDALHSAAANLDLNAVAGRVQLRLCEDPGVLAPARFELVIANIISSVLLPLRDALYARIAPGGTLILSGLLGREVEKVSEAYAATGLVPGPIQHDGEWSALVWRRVP